MYLVILIFDSTIPPVYQLPWLKGGGKGLDQVYPEICCIKRMCVCMHVCGVECEGVEGGIV